MAESPRLDSPRRQVLWLAVVAAVVVVSMAALVWWALARSSQQPVAQGPGFERYQPGWESAMAKAGVEATFPPEPVGVGQLRASGSQPFTATFTGEEITALMNVHPYDSQLNGTDVSLAAVEVSFPRAGIASARAKMVADGTGYDVEATMPLEWTAKGISSSGPVEMRAEGFGVPADRKQQAVTAIVGYLNLYVRAAPGLIVERAEIVDGGLTVTGSAPQRLEYPSSAP